MKGIFKLAAAAAGAAAAALFVTGCYYMPGSTAGNAKVALAAKGLPPNMSSVAVVVTAPGMAPVTATGSISSNSISVSVPAGPARTFTLLLNSPSATLQGVATLDLQPGETTSINVTPTLGATQLVIPDYQNGQLVQISDMSGTGWTTLAAGNLTEVKTGTGITTFSPWAVDFDSLGRIYIANRTASTIGGVIQIDDINHPTFTTVDGPYAIGIGSLAVDRTNNRVYYGGQSLAGGPFVSFQDTNKLGTISSLLNIPAVPISMAVDSQGMLYIMFPSTTPYLVKYDPTSQKVVITSSYTFAAPPGGVPMGIMVKEPYVYVCDPGAKKIERFDMNLNFVDSFSGPATDPFLGPEAFVATLNRKFTVIDEDNFQGDRLVAFDDMAGSGWTTFGSNGTGTNNFKFYQGC